MLAADGVSRSYGRERVLRGATLAVGPGGGLAILGPNGSGKSTLLRVLAASLRPSEGRVRVYGRDPFADPEARRAIGYVGHEPMLYGGLSAVENLRLFAALYGVSDPRARAAWACDVVGLRRRNEPVRVLSRGLMLRAALARAIVHRPTILLLDEALGGLDLDAAARVTEFLLAFRRDGGAIVFATHHPGEALRIADTAHVLARGRLGAPRPLGGMDAAGLETWYRAAAGAGGAR